jgi:heme-degrading monooxygenase HmoA
MAWLLLNALKGKSGPDASYDVYLSVALHWYSAIGVVMGPTWGRHGAVMALPWRRGILSPTMTSSNARADLATTPQSGYYAVIFSSTRTLGDDEGYAAMAERMMALAAVQPGYLGAESARGADGLGITVSYWESEQAIAHWKQNTEHLAAQESGKLTWYAHYQLRVAKVERSYGK